MTTQFAPSNNKEFKLGLLYYFNKNNDIIQIKKHANSNIGKKNDDITCKYICDWDVTNVTDMSHAFNGSSLIKILIYGMCQM